jgi:flagellar basal body-associated protein FliL
MEQHDTEKLNNADLSDTIESDEEPGTGAADVETAAPARSKVSVSPVLVALVLVGILVVIGMFIYHTRVSDSFSEAVSALFMAGPGEEQGSVAGKAGGAGAGGHSERYPDFLFRVSGIDGRDRVVFCDMVLEFSCDQSSDEPESHEMRVSLYRAARALLSEGRVVSMPPRLLRREIERRILMKLEEKGVTAVYFTRFVVI